MSTQHSLLVAAVIMCTACGQTTAPRATPDPAGGPLETAAPNVPEFKPAFTQQTRAPMAKSRTQFQLLEVARGLKKPWALAFLPDGNMLVTEKIVGQLRLVSPSGQVSTPIAGVPEVDGGGQGGLLDVELDPDYAHNQRIYLSYYEPREGGNGLTVIRARLAQAALRLREQQPIFRMLPTIDSSRHAGGRLLFQRDGTLFVTLGDRYVDEGRVQAQDLSSHAGKIVRILPDGSVPSDNPFVSRPRARPEIWSYGHRNILSAALDAEGRLWVVEMGPRGGDELNLIKKGVDYGWPSIGYGEEYSGFRIHQRTQAPGMEQPVYYWDPVISPSGMTIYTGDAFPEWKGSVFIGGLSSKALVRLVLKDDRVVGEERLLTEREERIREVVQGPDAALYLLTDSNDGKLLKLVPRAQR